MESHNQDEPLKAIMEWLSKRVLFDEVMEFLDDDPSNDWIERGVLENDKLNDTLKSALKKDIQSINECIKAIDLVNKDEIPEDAKKNLSNLREQLVLIKKETIKEKYAEVENITKQEFDLLCTRKSLTKDEVKKIVKHALENKEDELISLVSIDYVKDESIAYLQDAPKLYIPENKLTEQQKNILTNRVEI